MDNISQQGSDAAGACRGGMAAGTEIETVEGAEVATPVPEESKPRQRTRQTLVCSECKRLKLKCDRQKPCDNCVKRDTVHKCVYQQNAADRVDVHSLNNLIKNNEHRQKEENDAIHEQLGVLQEEMRGIKEMLREREREREMARMRDGLLPFAFPVGVFGPECGRTVGSSSSSSAQDHGRYQYHHQDRASHVGMKSRTRVDPARDNNTSASYGKARAALVLPEYLDDDEGVVFSRRMRAVAIDSTLEGEIGDSSGLSLSESRIGSGEDEDEEPPSVRYPELAAMFVSPVEPASISTTYDQTPRHTRRRHYHITPQLVSTLPPPPTRNFLFSKLKVALTSTAAGVGVYNRVFEKRVRSIWERIGRVGDGGIGPVVMETDKMKGKEKGEGRGDEGEGEGGNAKGSRKRNEKNVTLAQFALAVAALGVAVKWVWVAQGGKTASDMNPDSDLQPIDATLATTLYNRADTALTLQTNVERYSFDSVLALVLQGLALGMTNETKTGRTPGTRSDAMMKRVLNDALDRALGIGLQYDPGEIVVRRVGGRDDGGLAAGVHVLDVISKGMVEGPMRGRREDGEDATEGDGDEYGSSGTRREKGKEKGNASAIASAESRVQKASKTGRSGSSSRLTSREGEIRRRAWWSIVILDQTYAFLTDALPLVMRGSFSTCLPFMSANAGVHQARLPQPSTSLPSSTPLQPAAPPPPSSSLSSSHNASYVAFGDARQAMKSDFRFSISSMPPSEPTRSDAGTGTERIERNEYFVARCRFAQMALDVLHRVREIELDASHIAPSPDALSEFTTDVARETSRLLEGLPEDLQLSLSATVSNTEQIRLELGGENEGDTAVTRDTDAEAVLISRRCDLVIAARRILLSSCWLLGISNASGVTDDMPGVSASVLSLFERSTHETIFALRMLLALDAHLKDKMSKLVVFSKREMEKAMYDVGMKAATIASLCNANSGGNATRAMINSRAALRALTHPALSLAPGEISTAAKLLESHILKLDAKINKPRRKGVVTSTTAVKRKCTHSEMDADGELVDRRAYGDESADDAIGTPPLKRSLMPSKAATISDTGGDKANPVKPPIAIVDVSRVVEREGVSTPAAPTAPTAAVLARLTDAVEANSPSRLTPSQKKGDYPGDDHPMSPLGRIPRGVGSSDMGNLLLAVRHRAKDGKAVSQSRRQKGRKHSSSRSNARSDQAQPSSSQLPLRGVSHTTGLPRHGNMIAPTSPVSSTSAPQTSILTDPPTMLRTPQSRTPVPSTFFGAPTTPVQPPPQTPTVHQFQNTHSPTNFPPDQSYNALYNTSVQHRPPPPGTQLDFVHQAHSSPTYMSIPPAQTRSDSSLSHRPSISSTGTATPMELLPPQVASQLQSNVGAMPFEMPPPLPGPPPMSSLQPDRADMHHQPQYQYTEHAMQFTSPHHSLGSISGANPALHPTHPHSHPTVMMNQLPPITQQQGYPNMDQDYSTSPSTNQQPSWPSDSFDSGYGGGWGQ